jgi:hypothetical protein
VEQCADHVALFHEGYAALADGLIETVEVGVGEWLIDKLPQMLGQAAASAAAWLAYRAAARSGAAQGVKDSQVWVVLFLPS